MEVILVKDIDSLGKRGSVAKVQDGFARNFLFPRKFAIPVTPANLKRIEEEAKKVANLCQRERENDIALSERLNGLSITIAVATHDEDKLYGSIAASDIVEALKQENISEIDSTAVILEEPIKSTGVFEVLIKLHQEVSAKIKVWVVKK